MVLEQLACGPWLGCRRDPDQLEETTTAVLVQMSNQRIIQDQSYREPDGTAPTHAIAFM